MLEDRPGAVPAHAVRPRAARWTAIAAVLVAIAAAERFWNACAAPTLAGYDGFAHFTYVWFVAETGRAPMPTHGWSFFHPPLYYALMAGVWNALDAFDPAVRLKAGKLLLATLGLAHAMVAWRVLGRRFPGSPRAKAYGTAFALAVPVQLYSAGFLGNEGLHAVLGSLSLLALLAALERPTPVRGALLGACLGLAMLAKFSAVALVAAAFATLALAALLRRGRAEPALADDGEAPRRAVANVRALTVAAAVLLVFCGAWYARSIAAYGTPFQLSRDAFLVEYVEGNQPQAARGWADYLTFDPWIFRRPAWPRDATPTSDAAPHDFARAVRESVWTGLYANTWFDGFGGWVLPSVVDSELARRSGQLLLTLGLLPTGLVLVGALDALAALRRRGWRADQDETVVFALSTASMLALFVYGTHAAPIAGAVKATYLTLIVVAFAFWLAAGVAFVERAHRRWLPVVDVGSGLVATIALAVFCQGLLFERDVFGRSLPGFEAAKANQLGIVEYAGGRRDRARQLFEDAAAAGEPLALENLAALAVEDGRPARALRLLKRAARRQDARPGAGPVRRDEFLSREHAEIDHSIGVVLHALGRRDRAVRRWHRALARDPQLAEALYSATIALLEDRLAEAGRDERARRLAFDDAGRALVNVRRFDPGLEAGWRLAAAVEALRGDCDAARTVLDAWRRLPWWTERAYPVETGTGAGFSASIGRRRLIAPQRAELVPERALAACGLGPP